MKRALFFILSLGMLSQNGLAQLRTLRCEFIGTDGLKNIIRADIDANNRLRGSVHESIGNRGNARMLVFPPGDINHFIYNGKTLDIDAFNPQEHAFLKWRTSRCTIQTPSQK